MQHLLMLISAAAVLSALVLGGCGSSSASTGTKAKAASTRPKEVKPITFKSSAFTLSIPARYTCDGEDVSPPLEWGAVPSHTRELVLLVLGLTPSTASTDTISVQWALAGVNPGLHKLAAGEVPRGARLGLTTSNTTRYSICPARGRPEQYEFLLYSVPSSTAAIPAGFSGLEIVTVLGSRTLSPATGGGGFKATYKRK
jgi:phosphatidylethanolamine-binding protein (PEBP) family uncharacterized protein